MLVPNYDQRIIMKKSYQQCPSVRQYYTVVLLSFFLVPDLMASNFSAKIVSETEYHHNLKKVSTAEEDDIKQVVALRFNANESFQYVDVDANYSLEENIYQQDTFDENFIIEGGGRIKWRMVDDRLYWLVSHARTESQISSILKNVPTNREEKNIFITGPTWNQHLTSVDVLSFDLRFTDTRQDVTEANDSERYRGQLSWRHTISTTKSFSVSASQEDVNYDLSIRDSDDTRVTIEYNTRSRKTQTKLSLGASKRDPESGESSTEREYGIDFRYFISEDESFAVSVVESYDDTSVGPISSTFDNLSGQGSENDSGISDTFINNRIQVSYDLRFALSNTLQVSLSREDKDYDSVLSEDQIQTDARVSLSRQLAPSKSLALLVEYGISEYELLDREDKNWKGRITYAASLRPKLSFSAAVFYERENSDLQGNEYDDYGAILTFSYQLR